MMMKMAQKLAQGRGCALVLLAAALGGLLAPQLSPLAFGGKPVDPEHASDDCGERSEHGDDGRVAGLLFGAADGGSHGEADAGAHEDPDCDADPVLHDDFGGSGRAVRVSMRGRKLPEGQGLYQTGRVAESDRQLTV